MIRRCIQVITPPAGLRTNVAQLGSYSIPTSPVAGKFSARGACGPVLGPARYRPAGWPRDSGQFATRTPGPPAGWPRGGQPVPSGAVPGGAVSDGAVLKGAALDDAVLDEAMLHGTVPGSAVLDDAVIGSGVLDDADLRMAQCR
jgi:hypothetical protein